MFKRDQLVAMLVVGATTGALVACAFIAARFTREPGEVLDFFGGAVGAGLAVVGAVWLEDRKSARARENTKKMFTQALMSVGVTAHRFAQVPDVGVQAGILTFRQSVEAFEVIRSRVNIDDALGYFSMSSVIYWARVLDAEAAGLSDRLGAGSLAAPQVRGYFAPKLASLATIIRNTLTTAYWPKESLAEFDQLLATAINFDPETGLATFD